MLLLSAGIAVSCDGGGTATLTEPYHISFDLATIDRNAPFPTMSEMIEDIEYVKLEYVDGMPVGGISGIPAFTDDYIIFFDKAQGILQYRRDGSFVRRIGHIGRGPGEYQSLAGIYVNEKRGTIHTFPIYGGNQMHIYDLPTGRFNETLTITTEDGEPMRGYDIVSFTPLTDDLLLFSQDRMMIVYYGPMPITIYTYRTIDLNTGQITDSRNSPLYIDVALDDWMVRMSPTWRDYEGRVNIYENLADTMYVVGTDGSASPRIIPDFGSHKIKSPASDSPGISVDGVMESKRWILFEVSLDGKRPTTTMAFDRMTGARSMPPDNDNIFFRGSVNDVDGGFSRISAYDENIWWASYNAFDMIENLTPEHFERVRESVKYPDRLEKLQALVATLKEDDNPVIAIARLKRAGTPAAD